MKIDLMFNLQQRNNNVGSLFQPMNNPSLGQSIQNFVQKQEHNSDCSSKNSEKEDSPSKNTLFNDTLKGQGKSKKKDKNAIKNGGNMNNMVMNNNNNALQNLNFLQQQMNNNNMNCNNNAMNSINNLNLAALQQQNLSSFDMPNIQTEEQTNQMLLTQMIFQQQQMINQLLLNSSNNIPNQNLQQQQQQQQLNTLLQQQQLFNSLLSAQTAPVIPQSPFLQAQQPTPSIPQTVQTVQNTPASLLSTRYSISANEKNPTTTENDDSDEENSKVKNLKKSIRKRQKKINNCGHPDREHYAKGMCSNCYHKYGRTKKPWLCHHEKLYACGLCQNCYINKYNQKKRTENDDPLDGSEKIESDDQQQNFSEIDHPDKINQLTDQENQIPVQSKIKQDQDKATYYKDEDQVENGDEEDDAQ